MDELYRILITGCSERRAEVLCKLKTFLDGQGYEDMLIIHLDCLVANPDVPDCVSRMENVIVNAGVSMLMESGIEVNYDAVFSQPSILHDMLIGIHEKIEDWDDPESLLGIITDGAGYDLATVIATIMGDLNPSRYLDVLIRVQDRVYSTIKAYLEARLRELADSEEIQRIPRRTVSLIKLFVERFPTNQVAELFTTSGIDLSDDGIMRQIDYEWEPTIPKPYYHNMAVSIVGMIIRTHPYYKEGYSFIEQYAAQLVEPDGVKDMLAVCREANDILKLLHSEVDKDEEA